MRYVAFIILLVAGCSTQKQGTNKGPSPEPTTAVSLMPPLPTRSAIRFVAVPINLTNVTAIWTWPPDMSDVIGFKVYRGTNTGDYFASYSAGLVTNLPIAFRRSPIERDYFVATTVESDGTESQFSNEAVFPEIPNQGRLIGLRIGWGQPSATLQKSRDLVAWATFTNVLDISCVVPYEGQMFYRTISAHGTSPPKLTITAVYANP